MLLHSRQIKAAGGEITDIPSGWTWDLSQHRRPGYMLWVVFDGELTVQTSSASWPLRAGHIVSIPMDRDYFKVENGSGSNYHDVTDGPRIPARRWFVYDMSLFTSLYVRMDSRLRAQELWEATAVLSVLLDELAEQKVI